MGCDIGAYAERRAGGAWKAIPRLRPFDRRDYGMFGFLADVRNYSGVPPISGPRGLPKDASRALRRLHRCWDPEIGEDADSASRHSTSWLSLHELTNFDYDQDVEDRRVNGQKLDGIWYGASTCAPGKGRMTTYRALLGNAFFEDLRMLRAADAERIIFWFSD